MRYVVLNYLLVGVLWGVMGFIPTTYAQQTPAVPTTSKVPEKKEKTEKKIDVSASAASAQWAGSLMFSQQDIERINKALRSYKTNVPIEILLPDLFSQALPKRPTQAPLPTSPQASGGAEPAKTMSIPAMLPATISPGETPVYYLQSILYISPEEWTIWFDGKRISSKDEPVIKDEKFGNIRIISVSDARIIAVWSDIPSGALESGWKDRMISVGEQIYADKEMKLIYDNAHKRMSFMLEPNQALISYLTRVVEGYDNAKTLLANATGVQPATEQKPTQKGAINTPPAENQMSGQSDVAPKVGILEAVRPSMVDESDSDTDDQNLLKQYSKQLNILQQALDTSVDQEEGK